MPLAFRASMLLWIVNDLAYMSYYRVINYGAYYCYTTLEFANINILQIEYILQQKQL